MCGAWACLFRFYFLLTTPAPTSQLVLPTHPCPGIESADPLCTGAPAEKLWGAAYVTGVTKGFPPHGGDGQVGPITGRWATLLNAPNWRGQHQMHIHIAYFKPSTPAVKVVPLYINQTVFSTDPASPTVLTGADGTATATVFVPGTVAGTAKALASVAGYALATLDDGGGAAGLVNGTKAAVVNATGALPGVALEAKDAGFQVAPFEVAANAGAAAKPNVPYGIMVEPFAQPVKAGGVPVKGFAVSAIYYWSDYEGMDDSETTDCSSQCRPFE